MPPERFAGARLETVVCLRLLAFGHPVNAYYTAVRHAGDDERAAQGGVDLSALL